MSRRRRQVVPHRAVEEGPHGAPRHEERRHERGRHDESAHCRGARAQQSPPRTSPRGNEPQREARRDREGAYQQDRLQRDRCRRPQHETEREAAPDTRRPVDRDQDRGEPEHRPQHIGAVLQRTEEEERIEPCQHGAPRTHPRSEQPAADQGRQEQGCAPLRKHEEAHPEDGRGPLAHREQHRGAEQVEERHVIVEDVAIRQQSVRPRPHHVEVLGLVGVDPKAPRHQDTQRESEHQERRQAHALEAPSALLRRCDADLPPDYGRARSGRDAACPTCTGRVRDLDAASLIPSSGEDARRDPGGRATNALPPLDVHQHRRQQRRDLDGRLDQLRIAAPHHGEGGAAGVPSSPRAGASLERPADRVSGSGSGCPCGRRPEFTACKILRVSLRERRRSRTLRLRTSAGPGARDRRSRAASSPWRPTAPRMRSSHGPTGFPRAAATPGPHRRRPETPS